MNATPSRKPTRPSVNLCLTWFTGTGVRADRPPGGISRLAVHLCSRRSRSVARAFRFQPAQAGPFSVNLITVVNPAVFLWSNWKSASCRTNLLIRDTTDRRKLIPVGSTTSPPNFPLRILYPTNASQCPLSGYPLKLHGQPYVQLQLWMYSVSKPHLVATTSPLAEVPHPQRLI